MPRTSEPPASPRDDAALVQSLKSERRWRDAEQAAERWRTAAEAAADARGLAQAWSQLVELRGGRRDHAGAEQAFAQALAAAEGAADPVLLFEALAAGGEHAFHRRNLRHARERWERAVQTARGAGDLAGEARALTAVAEVHLARRAAADARRHLQEALELARRSGDAAREMAVCLALSECSATEPEAAIEWLKTAATLGRAAGNSEPLVRLARLLTKLTRLDEAEAVAEDASNVARHGRNDQSLARALLAEVEVREAAGRLDVAHRAALQRVNLLRHLEDAHGGAMALGDLGRLESLLGRHEQAIASFDNGMRAARAARKRQLDVRLYKELGEARARQGDIGGAINALLEAARTSLSLGRSLDAIEVLERLGTLGEFDGRQDQHLRRVEELATDCGPEADARDQLARARVLVHFGLHETAVRQLASSRADDADLEAQMLMVLGQSHRFAGRIGRAVVAFERRVAHERGRGEPRDLAFGLNSLGAALVDAGRTGEATAAFDEGLALLHELEDVAGEGILLNGLSLARHAAGDPAAALALLDRSLALQAESHDQGDLAVTLNIRGDVLCTLGRPTEALAELERSKGLFEAVNDQRGLSFALPRLGRARLLCGDKEGALKDLRAGVTLALRGADRRQMVRAMLALHDALLQCGQSEEAARWAASARERVERMEDPLLREQVLRAAP